MSQNKKLHPCAIPAFKDQDYSIDNCTASKYSQMSHTRASFFILMCYVYDFITFNTKIVGKENLLKVFNEILTSVQRLQSHLLNDYYSDNLNSCFNLGLNCRLERDIMKSAMINDQHNCYDGESLETADLSVVLKRMVEIVKFYREKVAQYMTSIIIQNYPEAKVCGYDSEFIEYEITEKFSNNVIKQYLEIINKSEFISVELKIEDSSDGFILKNTKQMNNDLYILNNKIIEIEESIRNFHIACDKAIN